MNKKTAHWVFGILDVAALFACYYVAIEWNQINKLIAIDSSSISIQQNFQFMLLIILLPVTHAISFLQSLEIVKRRGSVILIILFVFVFVSAFFVGLHLETKLQTSGYSYCAEQSEPMTFSEFRIYLNAGSECNG